VDPQRLLLPHQRLHEGEHLPALGTGKKEKNPTWATRKQMKNTQRCEAKKSNFFGVMILK